MPFYVVTEGADWYEPRSVVFVSTDLSKAQDEVMRLATDRTIRTRPWIRSDVTSIPFPCSLTMATIKKRRAHVQ